MILLSVLSLLFATSERVDCQSFQRFPGDQSISIVGNSAHHQSIAWNPPTVSPLSGRDFFSQPLISSRQLAPSSFNHRLPTHRQLNVPDASHFTATLSPSSFFTPPPPPPPPPSPVPAPATSSPVRVTGAPAVQSRPQVSTVADQVKPSAAPPTNLSPNNAVVKHKQSNGKDETVIYYYYYYDDEKNVTANGTSPSNGSADSSFDTIPSLESFDGPSSQYTRTQDTTTLPPTLSPVRESVTTMTTVTSTTSPIPLTTHSRAERGRVTAPTSLPSSFATLSLAAAADRSPPTRPVSNAFRYESSIGNSIRGPPFDPFGIIPAAPGSPGRISSFSPSFPGQSFRSPNTLVSPSGNRFNSLKPESSLSSSDKGRTSNEYFPTPSGDFTRSQGITVATPTSTRLSFSDVTRQPPRTSMSSSVSSSSSTSNTRATQLPTSVSSFSPQRNQIAPRVTSSPSLSSYPVSSSTRTVKPFEVFTNTDFSTDTPVPNTSATEATVTTTEATTVTTNSPSTMTFATTAATTTTTTSASPATELTTIATTMTAAAETTASVTTKASVTTTATTESPSNTVTTESAETSTSRFGSRNRNRFSSRLRENILNRARSTIAPRATTSTTTTTTTPATVRTTRARATAPSRSRVNNRPVAPLRNNFARSRTTEKEGDSESSTSASAIEGSTSSPVTATAAVTTAASATTRRFGPTRSSRFANSNLSSRTTTRRPTTTSTTTSTTTASPSIRRPLPSTGRSLNSRGATRPDLRNRNRKLKETAVEVTTSKDGTSETASNSVTQASTRLTSAASGETSEASSASDESSSNEVTKHSQSTSLTESTVSSTTAVTTTTAATTTEKNNNLFNRNRPRTSLFNRSRGSLFGSRRGSTTASPEEATINN